MKWISIVLVFLLIIAGFVVSYYYFYLPSNTITILFHDSKRLVPGDKLYLKRICVGKVMEVKPEQEKVAVDLKINKKYRDQFTSTNAFFIAQDEKIPGRQCVLSRTSVAIGIPLQPGDKIEGIDSFILWKGLDIADNFQQILQTKSMQKLLSDFDQLTANFEAVIRQIDLSKLQADIQSDIEALVNSIDHAIQKNDIQKKISDLKDQIDGLKKRLSNVKNSPETRQLETALDNFSNKLKEEFQSEKPRD